MGFSIRFIDRHAAPHIHVNSRSALGHVQFGSFGEYFVATVGYWHLPDYEESWRNGIARILAGEPKSALVTDMDMARSSGTISLFGLWRVNHEVATQEVVKPVDPLDKDDIDLLSLPGEREEYQRYSEWMLPIDDLARFYAGEKQGFGFGSV